MQNVKINDLKPGMITAKPVVDITGAVLLKEGHLLDEVVIERLKKRKMPSVWVEQEDGADSGMNEAERAEREKAINDQVDKMFTQYDTHPIMSSIASASKKFLLYKAGL